MVAIIRFGNEKPCIFYMLEVLVFSVPSKTQYTVVNVPIWIYCITNRCFGKERFILTLTEEVFSQKNYNEDELVEYVKAKISEINLGEAQEVSIK